MKVGIILPMFSGDPERVISTARTAEELGFDGVFAFDHFFPPGAPRDRPALEAFTTLGAVAALTERVALGTLVTRASLRPAGMLAKTASWLDAASGGRFILGIGSGDPIDRPEHQTYGIPMLGKEERRAHLEETVRALKALFANERFEGGAFVSRLTGPLLPASARSGGPPIWLGAQADQVVRMAARIADGWNGWGLDAPAFGEKKKLLDDSAGEVGRDGQVEATWAGIVLAGTDEEEAKALLERRRERGLSEDIWSGSADGLVEFGRALEDRGATWAVFVAAGPKDRAELIGREVVPHLQGES